MTILDRGFDGFDSKKPNNMALCLYTLILTCATFLWFVAGIHLVIMNVLTGLKNNEFLSYAYSISMDYQIVFFIISFLVAVNLKEHYNSLNDRLPKAVLIVTIGIFLCFCAYYFVLLPILANNKIGYLTVLGNEIRIDGPFEFLLSTAYISGGLSFCIADIFLIKSMIKTIKARRSRKTVE